jgi:hypothetical protein
MRMEKNEIGMKKKIENVADDDASILLSIYLL